MEVEHEWLTTAEVAAIFRVDKRTVSRWCAKGKYPRKYLMRTSGDVPGSKWLIHKDALKPKAPQQRYISQEERARQAVARVYELLDSMDKRKKKSQ